jgi:hypothetical protein
MVDWDDEADSNVGYTVLFYCMVCEEYFTMSPIAPKRCPDCFADPRYVIGPIYARNINLDKLKRKQIDKYGPKMRR